MSAVQSQGAQEGLSVSVIIPTYNRPDCLEETLDSIMAQGKLPREVLVVDDSTDNRISDLVKVRSAGYSAKGVTLTYIRNPRERSAAIARNVGLERAAGDIVLFVDDDVMLGPGYIEAILDVYRTHPDAVGVQGHMPPLATTPEVESVYNAFRKGFSLTSVSRRGCEVLRSFKCTYPARVDGVERCGWLSGTNQSYKRSALGELRYDESLKRYSLGEDVDLSFNVAKHAGGVLYIASAAALVHKGAQAERTPGNRMLYVEAAHSYYLFKKNISPKLANRLVFYWSRLGRLLLNLSDWIKGVMGRGETGLSMRHVLMSQVLWLSRRAELSEGNLSFLESYLKNQGL